MPKTVFVRDGDNEAGEPKYREVEVSEIIQGDDFEWPDEVELPEEVVKKTKTYKEQLDETVAQRKRYQKARDALQSIEADSADDGNEKDTDEEDEGGNDGKQVPTLDPDKLFEEFFTRLDQREQTRQQQAEQQANSISDAIKKFNLPDSKETREALSAVDPKRVEWLAERISAAGLKFEDAGANNPDGVDNRPPTSDLDKQVFGDDLAKILF